MLHPLPVSNTPWKEVALDFVTGLPQVGEFNAICVVIDRLTKKRYYIPCSDTIDARGMGNLYYSHIFRLHGLPDFVTSDRGTQFVNDFRARLTQRLGISLRLSSAYHPETDGQTENANKVMEHVLSSLINKMIGPTGFPTQNFLQTTIPHHLPTLPPFLLTTGIILLWALSRPS